MLRWRWGGNQGAREADFASGELVWSGSYGPMEQNRENLGRIWRGDWKGRI